VTSGQQIEVNYIDEDDSTVRNSNTSDAVGDKPELKQVKPF